MPEHVGRYFPALQPRHAAGATLDQPIDAEPREGLAEPADEDHIIGRAALEKAQEKAKAEGLKRTLVGLEMVDRGIARDGYKVLDSSGSEIGYVTSGSPAPFLKKNIALAYVPPQQAEIGNEVQVEIRGQGVKAQVVPTPFYKRPKK